MFYDVVLEMLFSKNPAIFNQLFAKIDEESDDNNPFAEKITTLPLITIQMTGLSDGTIVYKQIKFILGVNKLNLIKGGTSPISGALDYTSFIKKTLSLNGEFKSIIENLSIAYKKNKELIGGELNALIQSNFTEIKKTLAKKIGMPTSDKWSLTDKTTFHDIGVELDELKTKNIFK